MKTSRALFQAASSLSLSLACGALALGCGASSDGGGGDLEGEDTGGGGLILDGSGTDGGGLPIDGSGDPDGRIDPDAACAAESYDAARLPPNLYLLFDHSGSMKESVTGGTKWTGSVSALSSLVTKSTNDIKMGLKFFPPLGSSGKACTPSLYATPDVPVAPLSTSRDPILCYLGTGKGAGCGGITAAGPDGGGTPMAVALDQAVQYMGTVYKGDGTRVVVLITDGDPNGCGDITAVIAAAAKAPAEKVIVYVIGAPGGTVTNLSQVAAAGGGKRTPTCVAATSDPTLACHYQIGGASFEADLTAALDDIKGKALSCTFTVPPPTGGAGTIDKTKVNVDETIGGVTSTLPQDTTHTNGWDYTDGGATITVYGPECDKLKADPAVKIQIIFGCKTKGPA